MLKSEKKKYIYNEIQPTVLDLTQLARDQETYFQDIIYSSFSFYQAQKVSPY